MPGSGALWDSKTYGGAPKWHATARKVTLKDGSRKTVYSCAAHPGELRIKRFVVRAGKKVASYVKPAKK
jgi:hypothetical protein